jgi:23S rRNA (uracil1939-C5)-methyltransferase
MSRAGVEGVVHNVQGSQTNVIVGNEFYLVSGREIIEESVSGTQFMRPSGGFFQVNSYQTGILLAEARRLAGDGKRSCIVDLFCGVGVFACFLADLADRCLGVEFSQRLVDYAKMNAGRLKLSNTGFMCADADTGMDTILKKHAPDLVVVDPPRRGLSEELISILTSSPSVKQVLYISCQPENLARDLGRLLKGGFRVGEISCVDLFPHTPHVETVVRLDR